jgi:hypothetical protein
VTAHHATAERPVLATTAGDPLGGPRVQPLLESSAERAIRGDHRGPERRNEQQALAERAMLATTARDPASGQDAQRLLVPSAGRPIRGRRHASERRNEHGALITRVAT